MKHSRLAHTRIVQKLCKRFSSDKTSLFYNYSGNDQYDLSFIPEKHRMSECVKIYITGDVYKTLTLVKIVTEINNTQLPSKLEIIFITLTMSLINLPINKNKFICVHTGFVSVEINPQGYQQP